MRMAISVNHSRKHNLAETLIQKLKRIATDDQLRIVVVPAVHAETLLSREPNGRIYGLTRAAVPYAEPLPRFSTSGVSEHPNIFYENMFYLGAKSRLPHTAWSLGAAQRKKWTEWIFSGLRNWSGGSCRETGTDGLYAEIAFPGGSSVLMEDRCT